jgi:hypothetical protein
VSYLKQDILYFTQRLIKAAAANFKTQQSKNIKASNEKGSSNYQ